MNAKHLKVFIQPSGGVTTKYFDFIVTPKLSFVNFTSHSYFLTEPSMKNQADQFFKEQGSKLLFEPCFTLRAGYKDVKLQLQYSLTSFDTHYEDLSPINKQYTSVGLYILFSKRYNRK